MSVLKEYGSLLIILGYFIIACQGLVLKNDDLRFICKTYTESNKQLNETMSQLFDRLMAREVSKEELDKNSNIIARLIMAVTNQFGNKDYLKQTASDVVSTSLQEISSHLPTVSVVTGPPSVVFEAEGIDVPEMEGFPSDFLLVESPDDLVDQVEPFKMAPPWEMFLEFINRAFYRFLDQMKSMCRQIEFPVILDLNQPQQVRKFLLDLIIQRQKMFVQFLENERSKGFLK
ncbi:uncharacterized protein LOC141856820 [Brevipalpus obovatus]|uniref:uncharacterized protein LOC141856820 n=1 Tax=Brevipalpus obovatus TaxID=246614 RepID=UPI003D9F87DA